MIWKNIVIAMTKITMMMKRRSLQMIRPYYTPRKTILARPLTFMMMIMVYDQYQFHHHFHFSTNV